MNTKTITNTFTHNAKTYRFDITAKSGTIEILLHSDGLFSRFTYRDYLNPAALQTAKDQQGRAKERMEVLQGRVGERENLRRSLDYYRAQLARINTGIEIDQKAIAGAEAELPAAEKAARASAAAHQRQQELREEGEKLNGYLSTIQSKAEQKITRKRNRIKELQEEINKSNNEAQNAIREGEIAQNGLDILAAKSHKESEETAIREHLAKLREEYDTLAAQTNLGAQAKVDNLRIIINKAEKSIRENRIFQGKAEAEISLLQEALDKAIAAGDEMASLQTAITAREQEIAWRELFLRFWNDMYLEEQIAKQFKRILEGEGI